MIGIIDITKVPIMVQHVIDTIKPQNMAAVMQNITKNGIAKTMRRKGAIIMIEKMKAKLGMIIKFSRGERTGIETCFEGILE